MLQLAAALLLVAPAPDPSTIAAKVMCGYQGWFRTPGDAAGMGWVHWSHDAARLGPGLACFEMWPDTSDLPADGLAQAPGFTHPDGTPARLFSSDCGPVVRRHFEWMRDYGIDGAWLQHFLVDCPGGPIEARYESRRRVLEHVRAAAAQTGRVFALSIDTAAYPAEGLFEALTSEWRRLVDAGVTADAAYLHEGGRPVVQIWGMYHGNPAIPLTAPVAVRLADWFAAPGPYRAYVVAGGDWNWRSQGDEAWRAACRRFDAYCPWNIGNWARTAAGEQCASIGWWPEDLADCRARGQRWIPTVYPGFSWDNLKRQPPGTTLIARRRGEFLWEQFVAAARLGVDTVFVAMFDEVDEGTAIFQITSEPPAQGHWVGYEGLPSDWYLRLVGEGAKMLRGERPIVETIPLRP